MESDYYRQTNFAQDEIDPMSIDKKLKDEVDF